MNGSAWKAGDRPFVVQWDSRAASWKVERVCLDRMRGAEEGTWVVTPHRTDGTWNVAHHRSESLFTAANDVQEGMMFRNEEDARRYAITLALQGLP